MGDNIKLLREREDLYHRVAKTVNIDYDPKQVKPFLKQLAKNDSLNNFRPLGLANESRFPAELRTQFQFMLGPMAQNDPTMFATMAGGRSQTALS